MAYKQHATGTSICPLSIPTKPARRSWSHWVVTGLIYRDKQSHIHTCRQFRGGGNLSSRSEPTQAAGEHANLPANRTQDLFAVTQQRVDTNSMPMSVRWHKMPVQSMDIIFSSVLSIVHKSWNAYGPLVAEIALKKNTRQRLNNFALRPN